MAGKKLLVADDSLTIQKVIRLALSNEGYEIQAVSDGNDAVQQIALTHPDVVLIDVSLPGRTAFEVKREINAQGDLEEIRFVLMSSAFEKVDEDQVTEVEFHGRLIKPFDPAHLRQVLTDVLDQVTAKRMEKTSILQVPLPNSAAPHDLSLSSHQPPPLPPFQPELGDDPEEFPGPSLSIPPLNPNSQWEELPEPPSEEVSDLWEASDDSEPLSELRLDPPPLPSVSLPAPPAMPSFSPSPAPVPISLDEDSHEESDIQELTASTIQISGMDEDLQWSVNEPSLKPLPGMLDHGDTSFMLDPPIEEPRFSPPKIPTMESMIEPSGFDSPPEPPQLSNELTPPPLSSPLSHVEPPTPPPTTTSPKGKWMSEAEVEAMVKVQVQAVLERMAQKMLPEIAEKLIKQEIHRMLSD